MVGSDFEGRDADESLTSKVVEEVADRGRVDPLELNPPLAAVVDPDALDDLMADSVSGEQCEEIKVEFHYYGYNLTVSGDGEIDITDDV